MRLRPPRPHLVPDEVKRALKRPRPTSSPVRPDEVNDFVPKSPPCRGVGDSRSTTVQNGRDEVDRLGLTREFADEVERLAERAPSRRLADELRRIVESA